MWLQRRHSPSSPAHSLLSPAPPLFLISQAWACTEVWGWQHLPAMLQLSCLECTWAKGRGMLCCSIATPAGSNSSDRGAQAAHPAPSKHQSLLQPVFSIPLITPPTPSVPFPGVNCSTEGGWEQVPVSLSAQQAGSSQRSPLPRRLHNLPLIPDTPGMRWCPTSKYLSTTQISCPGSLGREESVSHGLGCPGGQSLSQSPPRKSAWIHLLPEELGWGVLLEPIPVCVWLWVTVLLQEGRSEDPSFPPTKSCLFLLALPF